MKKYLLFLIIFILISILLLSTSCEKQRIKNEIIKFDEEYYSASDNEKYDELIENINFSHNLENWNMCYKHENDLISFVDNNLKKLNSLKIPQPLDDFYHKKIQQFQYFQKANYIWLDFYKTDMSSYNERGDQQANDYFDKANNLWFEADKIRREVYREYGLDDLLYKYQVQ